MKPPVWGKAIGIIMISLGSLGVFLQLYKFMIKNISDISNEFNGGRAVFGGILRMTEGQATGIMLLATLGLLACVFYIIGGSKLLKPSPEGYKFTKYSLITLIAYNAIGLAWMVANSECLLIHGLSIYVGIGLALDIALLIIFMKSDPQVYLNNGLDENDNILNSEEDSLDFE